MLTIGSQRPLFDIPAGIAYFNTAYNSPLLNSSRAALVRASHAKSHPWERPPADFFDDAERIRALAASLFGGDADGYAVVPAASYGLSAAARAIQPTLKAGDRIVVLDEEFPSNVLPWRRVARETGAVVATVPTPADGDWTTATLAVIAQGARVAALSPVIGPTARGWISSRSAGHAARPVRPSSWTRPRRLVRCRSTWLPCDLTSSRRPVQLAALPIWRRSDVRRSRVARRAAARGDVAGARQRPRLHRAGRLQRHLHAGRSPLRRRRKVTAILPGAIAALEQLQAWGVSNVARVLGQITDRIAFAPPSDSAPRCRRHRSAARTSSVRACRKGSPGMLSERSVCSTCSSAGAGRGFASRLIST